MTQGLFTVLDNRPLTGNVYRMILAGDTSAITKPGQFVNIKIEGQYLRRPISVCDWEIGILTLIYKVVGEGTDKMAAMVAGQSLDLRFAQTLEYSLAGRLCGRNLGYRPLRLGVWCGLGVCGEPCGKCRDPDIGYNCFGWYQPSY
jgi:hypothetical protein